MDDEAEAEHLPAAWLAWSSNQLCICLNQQLSPQHSASITLEYYVHYINLRFVSSMLLFIYIVQFWQEPSHVIMQRSPYPRRDQTDLSKLPRQLPPDPKGSMYICSSLSSFLLSSA